MLLSIMIAMNMKDTQIYLNSLILIFIDIVQ